jgi:hypothetical protein
MANFIFNWVESALSANALNLSVGNYYAHLVTAAPLISHTTVADLTLPGSVGYTSAPLTGLSYNSSRWTFDNFSFPSYVFASIPIGVVICQRVGVSPESSDPIICYSAFNNSNGQVITLTVGTYFIDLSFGTNGAINFSYRYQYTSGAFDPALPPTPAPPGLIQLIGSKNNTLTYTNPLNDSNTLPSNAAIADRSTTVGSGNLMAANQAIDFGATLIRFGTIGYFIHNPFGTSFNIWASKNIGAFNSTNVNNNSLWTQLNPSTLNWTNGAWSFFNCTNTEYWRYLRFSFPFVSGGQPTILYEFELYDSSALSPTINFT